MEKSLARIMIVDDTPQNLKLLGNMLRRAQYQVCSFPKGEFALKAVERNIPDLILLDINMPGMNGYEVCRRLQENPRFQEIPVIFLSALNEVEDKIKAFKAGGVDYITKPFQFEEVIARIRTHLALRNARKELKELLDSTMIGSVRAMAELLAIIDAQEFGRTLRVARYVRSMVKRLQLPKAWKYEIASLLSNLGYALSKEDTWDARVEEVLGKDHSEKVNDNLALAAQVIRCIPRLENVPDMIAGQHYFGRWNATWRGWEEAQLGGQILKIANDLDVLTLHYNSLPQALAALRDIPEGYNKELLDCLEHVVSEEMNRKSEEVDPMDLHTGMILIQDMINTKGVKLLAQGTEITEHMQERIRNWALMGSIPDKPVPVLLPRVGRNVQRMINQGDFDDVLPSVPPV